jgi:glycosyltransferase involved in cell wall biosynthesis
VAERVGVMDRVVTVVVPTHNRLGLLRRTLASVLAQRDVEVRVVVVDDGSEDGTAEAIARAADDRVQVLRNDPSIGVARARNRGLEEVRSGWVAFLDDDDLWAPDKLASQVAAAEAVPGARWVCAGAVTVDEDLRVLAAMHPPPSGPLPAVLTKNRIPGGASGTLVRTELARSVGGFDPGLSNIADWEFWIKLALESPVASVDRPLTAYLRHTATLSGDPTGVHEEFERIRQRYEEARRANGVPASSKSFEWFARRQVRAGKRAAGARTYLTIARQYRDRPQAWALAVVAATAPGALVQRWDRQARRPLLPAWTAEAETWLAPLRSFPLDDPLDGPLEGSLDG